MPANTVPRSGPTAKKNPEDRLGHRSKADQNRADVINPEEVSREIEVPEGLEPDKNWHPVAKAAYRSYLESPLRAFYEDTDLVHLWACCELLSQTIARGMSAGQSQHLRQYMNDLGFTESARRAIDIQIKRGTPRVDPAKLASVTRMQERKAAGG
jgi:hypothetical protein